MLVTRLLPTLAVHYFFFILLLDQTLIYPPTTPAAVDDVGSCRCSDNNSLPKPLRKWLLCFGTINTIATVVTILLTLLNILVYKFRQLHESNSGDNFNVSEELCRRFSLADILSATNDFDDSLVIGRGGFGKVYKGSIDIGGAKSVVAIKRLNSMSKQGAPEFWTEITMLSKFRHIHLVSLIGYCDSYDEMILVYQYMARGTIADHLYKFGRKDNNNNVPLCWVQRLKICIGAARGLDYLHTGTGTKHRVIHRDVKSSNILLDENWTAKISDFGMSKTGPVNQSCTHVSTHVKGTVGYLDPEYFLTHRLTRKSDVYAFGVVLFEVLCGRPAVDLRLHEDQRGLARWAQYCVKEGIVERIIDPNLKWEIFPDSLLAFVKVANKCLHVCPRKRPTMTEVVAELETALTFQERRDYSLAEEDIFNDGGAYDSQEIVDPSAKEKVITNVNNGEHHDKKNGTPIHGGKTNFANKLRQLFLVTPGPISVHGSTHHATIAVPSVQLDELKVITNNFSTKSLIYVGKNGRSFNGILNSGQASCIKTLDSNKLRNKEFLAQVSMISKLKHENVVELLSYCVDGGLRVLAYEYAPNGSLHDILHGKVKIAVGAAKGLQYLHEGHSKPIIHRNITSSNVLLFYDDVAKIADFELSKESHDIAACLSSTLGTFGYHAPE
ncbi:hypothetical protein LguiB_026151 [Lonicera macranthoides]